VFVIRCSVLRASGGRLECVTAKRNARKLPRVTRADPNPGGNKHGTYIGECIDPIHPDATAYYSGYLRGHEQDMSAHVFLAGQKRAPTWSRHIFEVGALFW